MFQSSLAFICDSHRWDPLGFVLTKVILTSENVYLSPALSFSLCLFQNEMSKDWASLWQCVHVQLNSAPHMRLKAINDIAWTYAKFILVDYWFDAGWETLRWLISSPMVFSWLGIRMESPLLQFSLRRTVLCLVPNLWPSWGTDLYIVLKSQDLILIYTFCTYFQIFNCMMGEIRRSINIIV